MENLRIALFGNVRIFHDDSDCEIKLPRKISALLSYLLLQRHRTLSRDALASLFWEEQSQSRARECLNTALWRLRQALEPAGVPNGTYLLGSYSDEVGFNTHSAYWLDVAVFEEQARAALSHSFETSQSSEIETLEHTVELYSGDLLESVYDDWALFERERLRAVYIDCLIYLLQYYSLHACYEKGISIGLKILQLDPLREEVHRKLMELYAASDQRKAAIQQYQTYSRLLMEELAIQPLEETQTLYLLIQNGDSAGKGQMSNQQIANNLIDVQDQLKKIKGVIANLENQVQQIIQMIDALK